MQIADVIKQIETALEALYLDKNEINQELVKMIDILADIGKKCDKDVQELGSILEKALEAMEYRDMVLMCDVLEYNLLPFFKKN